MQDAEEPPSDTAVGREARLARQRLGLTQVQVADRLARYGVRWHPSAVAKMESGERPLRLTEAAALSQALGVPLARLVGLAAEAPPPVADPRAEQALRRIIDMAQTALDDPAREAGRAVDAYRAMLASLPADADRSFVVAALQQAEADLAAHESRRES